jgi:hypothetical protein
MTTPRSVSSREPRTVRPARPCRGGISISKSSPSRTATGAAYLAVPQNKHHEQDEQDELQKNERPHR